MRTFHTLPGDHRFFSVMAIVTSATIVAGFVNTVEFPESSSRTLKGSCC